MKIFSSFNTFWCWVWSLLLESVNKLLGCGFICHELQKEKKKKIDQQSKFLKLLATMMFPVPG